MITVGALLDYQELGTRVIAGRAGLEHSVNWAHVSELEDPTPWLEGGELLMTTGIGIPRPASRQVSYISRLAERRVAGIAIGDAMYAPPLSPAMLNLADESALPVLLTARDIPFIAIAKRVAAANRDSLFSRLATHLRVYESLPEVTGSNSNVRRLFDRLEGIAGFRLHVLTPTGQSLFPELAAPAFPMPVEALENCDDQSPVVRVDLPAHDPGFAFLLPVYLQRRRVAVLAAIPVKSGEVDRLVLHHIGTITALLAAELWHDRERERREGGERLSRFLEDTSSGYATLFPGFDQTWQVTFAALHLSENAEGWSDIHHVLSDADLAHVLSRRGRLAHIVATGPRPEHARLLAVLPQALPGTSIGLSRSLSLDVDPEIGLQESSAALRLSLLRGQPLHLFRPADEPESLLLQGSAMRLTVDRVLGPILTYDDEHGTDLHLTLSVFLTLDRNYKLAASHLGIHRQTLVYRLKRVEELTAHSLASTRDLCELWLAVRAHAALAVAEGLPQLRS